MPPVRRSRFEFAQFLVNADDDRVYVDFPDPPEIELLRRHARQAKAGPGDTWWTIAWAEFRTILDRRTDIRPTAYFYVVAWANNVEDLMKPIVEGTLLWIPTLETLDAILAPPPYLDRNSSTG